MDASTSRAISGPSLRSLTPQERIVAIADARSVQSADPEFDSPRPSPHLARWGIAPQDDDGIVIARCSVRGTPLLIAAQDERFVGGSVGARHGQALRRLFEQAKKERPAAVILLAASGGVRLYEANPAELELARALSTLLDLRASGVPVLAVGVANLFGGASVCAYAAERLALLHGVMLGVSGPAVIETTRGRDELDASDPDTLSAVFGASSRARARQVEALADNANDVRAWIAQRMFQKRPFASMVHEAQDGLSERLRSAERAQQGSVTTGVKPSAMPPVSTPPTFARLWASADAVDPAGWLRRLPGSTVYLARPCESHAFGAREINALDSALLSTFAAADPKPTPTLFLVENSFGHEVSRNAEALCLSQYLAQHAAVIALLSNRGVTVRGLVTGVGHSAAFFSNALQAPLVYAVPEASVVAMEPAAIARVTRVSESDIAALIEGDALIGHPVRHFASWGGIAEMLPDVGRDRLIALAHSGS